MTNCDESSADSSSTAAIACSKVSATMTPFPAARPSALMTIGAPCSLTYSFAAWGSLKVLEDSSWHFCLGHNFFCPRLARLDFCSCLSRSKIPLYGDLEDNRQFLKRGELQVPLPQGQFDALPPHRRSL